MKINGPNGTRMTRRGWVDADTGKMVKAHHFTAEQVAEWEGVSTPTVVQLNEAPPSNKSLEEMTKVEIESIGRQHGIELDRRHTKDSMIEDLQEHIEDED